MSDPASGTVWALVAAVAVGTFALRFSFIAAYGWLETVPPWLDRWLAFVPASVLAALITPAVFPAGDGVVSPRLLAALLAGVVAWRTDSMTATIAVGMGALWTLQFLVG